MNQYINPYFGISVEFPDGWRHGYFGNRNIASEYQYRHQMSYNDIPSGINPIKELFFASKDFQDSCGMRVLYKPSGYDISEERDVFADEVKREYGNITICQKDAKFLYTESKNEEMTYFYKFMCWEHQSGLWLSCGSISKTEEGFCDINAIFNSIKSL